MPVIETAIFVAKQIGPGLLNQGFISSIKFFFRKKNYIERLTDIIYECMNEFEMNYPYDVYRPKFPFYHSQILLDLLLKYRVLGVNNIKLINEEFSKNSNIIIPEEKLLNEFYTLFLSKIRNDKKLKHVYIKENFQEEIFNITQQLTNLKNALDDTIYKLNYESNKEYEEWFLKLENDIKLFKPKSALDTLNFIEDRIKLKNNVSNNVLSKMHYLRGICLEELWRKKEACNEFLEAHRLENKNINFLEKAIVSLIELSEFEIALKKVNDILEISEFNEIGLAIKTTFSNDFKESLSKIPSFIRNSEKFKTHAASGLVSNKKFNEIELLYENEKLKFTVPNQIIFSNKDYWGRVNSLYFQLLFKKISSFSLERRSVYSGKSSELKSINIISNKFTSLFENTEKFDSYLHNKFIYHLTRYLMSGSVEDVSKMEEIYPDIKVDIHFYTFHLVYSLCHINKYDKAIKLIDKSGVIDDPFLIYIKYHCLSKQKDSNAPSVFYEYSNRIEIIDEINIFLFIDFMNNNLLETSKKRDFVKDLISNKKLNHIIDINLLTVFANLFDKDKLIEVVSKLDSTLPLLSDDQKQYKYIIATFFYFIKEYSKSINILNNIVNENEESPALALLIDNLYEEKENKDIKRLLRLLKFWRLNCSPMHSFFIHEINLLFSIPDWIELELVSHEAYSQFPNNSYFLYTIIISLYKQNNKEGLNDILNSKIKNINFTQDELYRICKIAVREKNEELAFELMYPLANNVNNKTAREYFFSLYGLSKTTERARYDFVDEELCVKVKVDNNEEFIEINKISLKNDPRTKNMLNSKIGDKITFQVPMTGDYKTMEIIDIYDKYQKLSLDIMNEVREGKLPSMNLQAIEFESMDLESMNKKIMETFGKVSEFRSDQMEAYLNDYYNRKISFGQVCRSVFDDSFLDAYYFLTSNRGNGFNINQYHFHKSIDWKNINEFILDTTSLLLFYELQKEFGFKYPHKFILSTYCLDELYEELYKTEQDKESKMSLQITSTFVLPILYPENYKEKRIEYLNDLIKWTEENTIRQLVAEKLNITARMDNETNKYDEYFELFVDTAFLADPINKLLISDDTFFYQLFQNRPKIISSEAYLIENFPKEMVSQITPYLLKRNYKGIQVLEQDLMKAFEEHFGFDNNNYHKALQNIPYNIFKNIKRVDDIILFVRNIYLKDTIILQHKKNIIMNVFVFLIKGLNSDSISVQNFLVLKLKRSFYLLQNYIDDVIDDLKNAIRIVYH